MLSQFLPTSSSCSIKLTVDVKQIGTHEYLPLGIFFNSQLIIRNSQEITFGKMKPCIMLAGRMPFVVNGFNCFCRRSRFLQDPLISGQYFLSLKNVTVDTEKDYL